MTEYNIVTIHEEVNQTMTRLGASYYNNKKLTGLEVGFQDIDNLTGGLHPGHLIIVAGHSGMGKTSLVNNIAEYVAVNHNKGVAIFSPEMTKMELVERFISSRSQVDLRRFQRGLLDQQSDELDRLLFAASKLADAPIFIDDAQNMRIDDLMTNARRLKQEHDIKLIIVDCLSMIKTTSQQSPNCFHNAATEIARDLKILAKELNIPVVTVCQLYRKGKKIRQMHLSLSSLGEYGSLEQYADVVMFLFREEYYEEDADQRDRLKGIARIHIAKQRNGPIGFVDLVFHDGITRFENSKRKFDFYEDKDDSVDSFE